MLCYDELDALKQNARPHLNFSPEVGRSLSSSSGQMPLFTTVREAPTQTLPKRQSHTKSTPAPDTQNLSLSGNKIARRVLIKY